MYTEDYIVKMALRLGISDSRNFKNKGKKLTLENVRRWLEETHKTYVELIVDGWGDDNGITKVYYRGFIWKLGHPRPEPYEDLGCSYREHMLIIALETIMSDLEDHTAN
jgi:hypothetical protein